MARETVRKYAQGDREAYVDHVVGDRAFGFRVRRYERNARTYTKLPNLWFTSISKADGAAADYVGGEV